MTVNDYPEFVRGQTLTADELNLLADHAWHRDRLVGRMTGFGVNCGLAGSFSGSTLTIQPGLAVDQSGEPLVMREARTLAFPATAATTSYPFVGTAPGGWSVVLRASDTAVSAAPCTEDDCAGHSDTHTRGVVLEVVPGRVTGPRFDFASHPALGFEPLRLSQTAQPVGSYATLRDQIAGVLQNSGGTPLVAQTMIDALKATTIAPGDLVGVKGYKVGWLNTVLAALIDFLRCRALMSGPCFRDDAQPGVVLGWVTQAGPAWTFHCSYRHAWEPPKGLALALIGGTCGDPCGASHDNLEAILTGYAPPDPPPAPTPPPSGGGGIIIPDPPIWYCPHGWIKVGGKCINVYYPPIQLIPEEILPFDPEIYFIEPHILLDLPEIRVQDDLIKRYGVTPLNELKDGVLNAGDLLGHFGVNVKATIEDTVTKHGGTPDVVLVQSGDLKDIPGYEPGTSFAPSDTVVLTVDGQGLAIGMGRVPGLVSVRQSHTAIPAATKAVAKVDAAVKEIGDLKSDVGQSMDRFDADLKGLQQSFGGLQQDFLDVKGGAFDSTGYGMRIGALERQVQGFGAQGERIAHLEGRVSGLPGGGRGAPGFSPDVAKGLQEFAQSTIEAVKTIRDPANRNLARYVAAAERSQAEFELAAAAEDPEAVGLATVELLDSMRTMVKAAGVDATAGRRLDAQFREIRGMFQ